MGFFYKSTDDGYIIPSFSCNGTNYIYFLYALFFFAVPSFLSCLSPGGLFSNCLQGIGFTSECDPGGFYIPSAHQIFEADGKNIFMGHPGITLQFILAIIQVLYFKIANTQNLSYSQFLAFNLDNLYLISKILMSLINVGVIFLFFRTAKLFGLSQFGSFAASLGYATSISVLYYLSKISVEPIMVFFLLYNIIFLKKGLDENNYNLFYLFCAGCFTAFNFYTKINMMGIMPFVSVAYISMVCWNNAYRPFLKKFILFYSFGFILIFISFLPFTNWTFFFATWASQNIAPPPDNSQSVLKSFFIVFSKFYDMIINLSLSFSKLNFSFDNTIQGVFNRIEYLYILISFVGLLIYFFKRTIQKEIWILVTVSVWCAFLWWYRGTTKMLLTWHYLYINVLLLSLGFGYLVEFFCKSLRLKSITLCTSLLIIAIALLHHASIYTYLDSRAYDIKQYNAYPSLFFKVMHSINSTDKVAALCQKGNTFNSASIFHCLDCSYTDGKQPRLLMNIPITAISIENFKSNADIFAQLSASGYTHYLDFTRGFSTNTEFHRLSNIANANIF